MDLKKEVKEFWNSNPVDGLSEDVRLRIEYRKRKDRWMNDNILPLEYKGSMLSVGCGQGTDIMSALQKIDTNDILIGLDISLDSIRSALKGIKELSDEDSHIYFINGDAEKIPFNNGVFDTVWSFGVLHHTSDIRTALFEIKRVLKPGGKFYLMLYRSTCPKGIAVRFLRWLSQVLDRVTRQDFYLYTKLKELKITQGHGTAFYELFGCPILNLYSRSEVNYLLKDFKILKMELYESGIYQELVFLPKSLGFFVHIMNRLDPPKNIFGFHWVVIAEKE
ncbi:MAG: hypothetical protein A3F88_03830 [Deltaproteobacteria bacterium RIFCSPLOWO2_12_FULL_42_16]|nr:MAG: hypothetical protein A3F88_03830 [Deltaproteobacteria bacterium RIFCSPLOWO2_12_FULL_42_16]